MERAELLATFMHEEFEKIARANGWKCKTLMPVYSVPFNNLSEDRQKTMIELARRILDAFGTYELKKSWLDFHNISNEGRKTKIFKVENKVTKENLGEIRWDGGWRQYVFDDGELRLAEGCLYELFTKIKKLREERESVFEETKK